jgi:hypothetical protein
MERVTDFKTERATTGTEMDTNTSTDSPPSTFAKSFFPVAGKKKVTSSIDVIFTKYVEIGRVDERHPHREATVHLFNNK